MEVDEGVSIQDAGVAKSKYLFDRRTEEEIKDFDRIK